eukprot:m.14671 g.14671  ORF g.14671 m.14671 type:complete len:238 (+) comp4872_c0_seq1:622-1335(+)
MADEAKAAGTSVLERFTQFKEQHEHEQDVRESIRTVVREIEAVNRDLERILQGCHTTPPASLAKLLAPVPGLLEAARGYFAELVTKFPAEEYYRYNGHWRNTMQQLVFLAAWHKFLVDGTLLLLEDFEALLQSDGKQFPVDLEDYLLGVALLPSELGRLAKNSVTLGAFERPQVIYTFVSELYSGFRLLNLKNDGLRRRFDGLKYDIKALETTVYDLSIRGLLPQQPTAMDVGGASA